MPFRPPFELVMEIVEWVALDPYRGGVFHADQRTLLACARVSPLWRAHSQRILLRRVRLKSTESGLNYKSAVRAFTALLERLRASGSSWPNEVAALSIAVQSAYFSKTANLSCIPAVLGLVPKLKALHITILPPDLEIPDLFSFNSDDLACLKSVACASTIHLLSLESHISDPHILHQLLSAFPNVRTLTLEAQRHSTTYADPLDLPSLRTLVLGAPISRKCLQFLYRCTMPAIRSLVLDRLDDLARVQAHFFPFISALTVFDAPFDPAHGLEECILEFPSLTRLVVGLDVARNVLDRLQESVEHFSFNPYKVSSLDSVLEWLDGRSFIDSVATVFHPQSDDERMTPERERVMQYCTDTGREYAEVYRMHEEDSVEEEEEGSSAGDAH